MATSATADHRENLPILVAIVAHSSSPGHKARLARLSGVTDADGPQTPSQRPYFTVL
jgi:hypothetical protein